MGPEQVHRLHNSPEKQESDRVTRRKAILEQYCREYQVEATEGIELCRQGTDVSVVIPAFNEADFIQDTLLALNDSDYPLEVVIVDNGSTDTTSEVIAQTAAQMRYPVTVLTAEAKGPVFARKRGMDEIVAQYMAKGNYSAPRYIAMTDADTLVPPNWARAITSTFKQTNASALGGRYRYPQKLDAIIEHATGVKDYFGLLPRIAQFLAQSGLSTIVTSGANAAIEVVPYAAIGGSQQPRDAQGNLIKGNDMRFGDEVRALGGKVEFLPAMTITNARREIYSLAQHRPQHSISSMQGWVNCREQDYVLLEQIAPDLDPAALLKHRDERGERFVSRTILVPYLTGQLDPNRLAEVLGTDTPFMQALMQTKHELDQKSPAEHKEAAAQLAEQYSSFLLTQIDGLIESNNA